MIRPLSSFVFYTVLLATTLFFCGIYLHIQHGNKVQKEYYTHLTSDVQSKLVATLLTLPMSSLPLNDSIYYAISRINNIPYFSAFQKGQNNKEGVKGLLTIDSLPLSERLNQFILPITGPSLLALRNMDTVLFSSAIPLLQEIQKNAVINPSEPVKYYKYIIDNKKLRFIRISAKMPVDLYFISFYPTANQYSLSILMLIISYLLLLAGTILFPTLFKKELHKQIREINQVVESISEKDFDTRISEEYPGELGALTRSINQMSQQLKEVYHGLEIRVIRRTSEISMRNAELRKTQREILKQNHELKSAYDALKESREKYEKLIEHLEDEYFFYSVAENGTLLFVSPSVKKILGYSVGAYRNLHNQLYTDNPINIIARERIENTRHGMLQPKYVKEIFDFNKQPKILEVSEVPVFNDDYQLVSIEGLAHDITERQKAEELIKEQEERYRMLFTHASDFIFMYELDKRKKKVGQFIEANRYTIEKLGYTIDELRQKTPLNLIAAEIGDDSDESIDEYKADDSKFERIWESKDGNMIDVEISTHSFKIKNKNIAIAVARDISDRKRAEEEVRFVNEELVNQKENLEALVDNLTQTQEQLVQSEKMAALGQLIAGIAHEVNTPLGAIKASIGNLGDSLDNALGELPALFQTQSADNLKLFTKLFELARQKKPELTSREKRQRKRELNTHLVNHQVEEAEILADLLVYLEIYEIDDELINSLKPPDAVRVVKSARNFISLLKNTNTINIAVEKATKVVFALKKYAHRDAMGEKVSTDIIDSIETVLTLYHNQLKQGVEVIRNYEKLPLIQCYQDEISQVWTNLIQNAIQAMHLEGNLTISTHLEKELVWIDFKDTGPGIEPDIIDKIFEPFFTTKKQGEGSGLGLDIVKKIIDKHNGTIEVDSKLGEGAKFIIKIPVK